MKMLTLSNLLDDLRTAEQAMRRFEQRYWLSSEVFYELYKQGALDDGSYTEEFAEWAGHCKLRQKRDESLKRFSNNRINELRRQSDGNMIKLTPQEPVVELV